MYSVSKEFSFEASHQLEGLPDIPDGMGGTKPHPCMKLHGHSYRCEVIIENDTLDGHGFVVDFHELDPLGEYIKSTLDHQHLNSIMRQPTSERIAQFIYGVVKAKFKTYRVTVGISETQKTWASYTEDQRGR